jgi:hypothetical protein
MKLQQISVFLENKPGQLKQACRELAQANINIVTLSLADSKQYGILRLITPQWQQALDVFKQSGFVANVTQVLAVEVSNHPGGLLDLLSVIDVAGVNVEYMYAFSFGWEERAILIFRFDRPDEALKELQEKGINVIGSVELFERSKK